MTLVLSLTVFQAESLALARNPSLASSEHSTLSSRWSAWGSWAGLGPQVSVSASYSDLGAVSPYPGTGRMYNIRLSVYQPLFSTQRLTRALSSTRSWQASAASLEYQRLSVRLQADRAFVEALKAQEELEVREKALKRAREALKLTQEKFNLGQASKAEVAKARADALSAELALLRARAKAEVALLGLKEVLGGFEPKSLEPPPAPDTSLPPLDSLVRLALERRGDLRQLERSAAASGWSFWGSLLSFSPEVGFSWSRNYWGEDFPSSLDDFQSTSGREISLSFSLTAWPFNFMGALEAKRSAEASVEAKRLSVVKEVSQAYEDFRAALEGLRVARAGYEASKEAYELTKAQYELGSAGVLELADAERALAEAELNWRSAELDLFLARRSLEIAVGVVK